MSTTSVLHEVLAERIRQDAKWGEQNHPNHDPSLTERDGGVDAQRLAEHYEVPTENRAKFLCEDAFKNKHGSMAVILIEEVAEAVTEQDPKKLRAELVQVAAVAVKWVEAIDRRKQKRK